MTSSKIKTSDEALTYMTECTLETVAKLAMKRSATKAELERQIEIAQFG